MEICFECGRSVKFGSGRFVNTYEERKANGKRYPKGDYLCAECEKKNA